MSAERALRIGVGGPVGSGKSSLIAALCRELSEDLRIGVVTNDIYTTEDAQFLRATGVLPAERIVAVQTGCCPHTAIRDDITINLEAVEQLEADEGPLDLVLVESGGDNLTAIFSPALADVQIFVIDVAGGDDIPRKGGPGIARADLLVINKTDLAPFVGSDVARMLSDATQRRGDPARDRALAAHAAAGRAGRRVDRAAARRVRRRRRAPALDGQRSARPSPRSRALALNPPPRRCSTIGPGGSIAELRRGPRLAPRILGRDAGAVRAAFVPTQAGPLAGDEDLARIVVRAGATLIVEPVAATLALPGAARTLLALEVDRRGGRPARARRGAADRRLRGRRRAALHASSWRPGRAPRCARRSCSGATASGRARSSSSLRATLDGRALLHDGLRLRDGDAHVALAPGHRVVTTMSLLGLRPPAGPGVLELEGAGALLRASGPALAAVAGASEPTWRAWSALAQGLVV